jgi:type IV pilus assembly protein PilM
MGLFGSSDITGIDIGAGAVKIVRIARSGKRPKLLSAGIVDIPPDQSTASGISADLRYFLSKKLVGRKNIVTLLPGKDLTIRSMTLPKMPLSELNEAVRWEAKRHVSYPLETALVEYLITGERHEGTVDKYDILMVAAERGTVVEHLSPFREAGITVAAVDANALALRNVLHLREKPADENYLVVDMGAGKTEINIFKGGVLRFSRCIESGGIDMTRSVADSLAIGLGDAETIKQKTDVLSPAEDDKAAVAVKGRLDILLMEIRRSVEYYKTTFREKSVNRTVLTGGVPLMQGIQEYFARSLEGPVELDQPFAGLTVGQDMLDEFGPQALRFSAAVGLALRRV